MIGHPTAPFLLPGKFRPDDCDDDCDDDGDDNDDGDDDYNRTLVGGAGSDDICGVITECSSAGCRANDIAVNSTSSLLTSPLLIMMMMKTMMVVF